MAGKKGQTTKISNEKMLVQRRHERKILANSAEAYITYGEGGKIEKIASPRKVNFETPEWLKREKRLKDWEKKVFPLWFQGKSSKYISTVLKMHINSVAQFRMTDLFKEIAKKLLEDYFLVQDITQGVAAQKNYKLSELQNDIVRARIEGKSIEEIAAEHKVANEIIELELQNKEVIATLDEKKQKIAKERREITYPALLNMSLEEAKKRIKRGSTEDGGMSDKNLIDFINQLSSTVGDKEKTINIGMEFGRVEIIQNQQNNTFIMPEVEE